MRSAPRFQTGDRSFGHPPHAPLTSVFTVAALLRRSARRDRRIRAERPDRHRQGPGRGRAQSAGGHGSRGRRGGHGRFRRRLGRLVPAGRRRRGCSDLRCGVRGCRGHTDGRPALAGPRHGGRTECRQRHPHCPAADGSDPARQGQGPKRLHHHPARRLGALREHARADRCTADCGRHPSRGQIRRTDGQLRRTLAHALGRGGARRRRARAGGRQRAAYAPAGRRQRRGAARFGLVSAENRSAAHRYAIVEGRRHCRPAQRRLPAAAHREARVQAHDAAAGAKGPRRRAYRQLQPREFLQRRRPGRRFSHAARRPQSG